MANRMTTVIMNNIVEKCSNYKRIRNKSVSSNTHLSEKEVKTLSSLIKKNSSVISDNANSIMKEDVKTLNNDAIKLDDIIGKKGNSKSTSSKLSKGKVGIDEYIRSIRK
ncbi:MAG: hypothetical protein B7C24_13545 [Bacteroidetes bacterium 4572_77]|nr:MAG: hypothetical protein B7C24_13545 [Bacteroidetes bacterium 4572_77]